MDKGCLPSLIFSSNRKAAIPSSPSIAFQVYINIYVLLERNDFV